MKLNTVMATRNPCYQANRSIRPAGIMVHSTGANNPNLRRYVQPDDGFLGRNPNNNSFNEPGKTVCVHAFIGRLLDGSIATYQILPWTRRGWHCGSGRAGSGNNTHISFEICEDNLGDAAYFAAVYKEAVEFCAYLCKLYALDPARDGVLICHSEGHARGIASNHGDVMHWFPRHGRTMDTFRADVALEMQNESEDADMPVIYKTLDDVPAWGRAAVEQVLEMGYLQGDGNGDINLTEDLLRMLVINDRAKLYGDGAAPAELDFADESG